MDCDLDNLKKAKLMVLAKLKPFIQGQGIKLTKVNQVTVRALIIEALCEAVDKGLLAVEPSPPMFDIQRDPENPNALLIIPLTDEAREMMTDA